MKIERFPLRHECSPGHRHGGRDVVGVVGTATSLGRRSGAVFINPIIYAELAPAFGSAADLERWLDPDVFGRLPLPYSAGWLAAQAYVKYRRNGGVRNAPLPDFYIGAHAEAEHLILITRDTARYRTYFPNIALVAPA